MNLRSSSSPARLSLYALLLVSLIYVFVKIRQVSSEPKFIPESYAISWDGYGYYLHLPATIIHHDPGMENRSWIDSLNQKYQSGRPFYQVNPGQKNRQVNVYTTGAAICWLPFFLCGHAYAGLADYPQDGLSPPYQYAIMLAGLFYAVLGFFLLRRLLLKFVSDQISAFVILLIGLGTNLYMYASYECTITHIILFAFDTLIVLLTISWHENPKRKTAFLLGLVLGLVTIIRPPEIIWLLVPLFWNVAGLRAFISKIRFCFSRFSHLLLFIAGAFVFGSVQLLYWKYASGTWFSNNHSEGFDFFNPFILEVLFSYKKGWLLYTPIMLFAIAGLFLLFRANRKLFVPLFLFFVFNFWIVSSWENWWYAGSFSQRALTQSYSLMAIPLALLIKQFSKNRLTNLSFGFILIALTLLNQFQSWQHVHGILSGELTTKAYYWKVFGRTTVDPEWKKLLEVDRANLPAFETVAENYKAIPLMKLDFENSNPGGEIPICDTFGFNSRRSLAMSKQYDYANAFEKPFKDLSAAGHLRFRISADIFASEDFAGKNFTFAFYMIGLRGQNYGTTYAAFDTTQIKTGKWSHIQADFITPHLLHSDDRVHLMSWNTAGTRLLLDNVELVAYEPKP